MAANPSGGAARSGNITVTTSGGSATLTVTETAFAAGTPTVAVGNAVTNGSLPSQAQQTISLQVGSPNGPATLGFVRLMIANFYGAPYACQMLYYPQSNSFYFADATLAGNSTTAYTLGAAGQQAVGTHCSLDLANSSATLNPASSTASITLNLRLTMRSSAVGMPGVYGYTYDQAYTSNANFWNSLAAWTAFPEISTAAPTVSMAQAPVVSVVNGAASQVLRYKFSDGNGYTYLAGGSAQVAVPASPSNIFCGFDLQLPNGLNLYSIVNGNYTWLGSGTIGGGWSYPAGGVLGQAGLCWVDLNNSKVHVNPNAALPDPDPNSGLYKDLYADIATSLEPPVAAVLPLNLYLGATDLSPSFRFISGVQTGTWPAFPALSVSTISLPQGSPGQNYFVTLAAAGGSGSFTWTATGLQPVLSLSAAGIISGVPAGATTLTVVATATDTATGLQATRTWPLTVVPAQTSQTITFVAPGNVTFGTGPFGLSATASSGLAVGFGSTTTGVCTVSGATVTVVGAGTLSSMWRRLLLISTLTTQTISTSYG